MAPEDGMTHIVLIPFTGIGLHGGYRGDEWFKKRIEIFKAYTLKSLGNQTNKDFIIWCTFRPQEMTNPYVAQIRQAIYDAGLTCVFTYNGPPFYDDKFGGSLSQRLLNAARIVRSCYRNKTWRDLIPSIKETLQDKNASLESRLGKMLKALEPSVTGDVLLTRIDSDDMFHMAVIGLIQERRTHPGGQYRAQRMTCGYIYNTDTGQLAEYEPTTNPPFYTISFSQKEFLDAAKHIAAYEGFRSHEDIINLAPCLVYQTHLYCVTTRDPKYHISTTFNHPFKGREITDILEKQEILRSFGI